MASNMGGMSSSSNSPNAPMTMMVFTTSQNTPLYSSSWAPSSPGQYAATCMFLILLATLGRYLIALKAVTERRWLAIALNRRLIAIAGRTPEATLVDQDPDAKVASLLTPQGVEESVKVIQSSARGRQPWRFSVDLPRALLYLCIATVIYLLMLAVMTMNVGYFCSVLAGTFLGELIVGRYIDVYEH